MLVGVLRAFGITLESFRVATKRHERVAALVLDIVAAFRRDEFRASKQRVEKGDDTFWLLRTRVMAGEKIERVLVSGIELVAHAVD